MRYSEWIALAYFAFLTIAAWTEQRPARRRIQLTVVPIGAAAFVLAVARTAAPGPRAWAPLVSIMIGYYASGWLFVRPSRGAESWLRDWDRRLLGDPATRFCGWPVWLVAYLDIVYTGCFLLLPIGFAVLAATGAERLADRYWSAVSIAELGSFGGLAFIQSRPPWAVEPQPALPNHGLHRAASHIVRHLTIGVNTFPSGHVAGSLAIGLAVVGTAPAAGAVLLIVAVSIAAACIVGRYHYVMDVAAGALVGTGAWIVARLLVP